MGAPSAFYLFHFIGDSLLNFVPYQSLSVGNDLSTGPELRQIDKADTL